MDGGEIKIHYRPQKAERKKKQLEAVQYLFQFLCLCFKVFI